MGVRVAVSVFTAFAMLASGLAVGQVSTQAMPAQVPAGTEITFHVTAALSSNESKTGQRFQFVLLQPIVVGGVIVAAAGAVGDGTLILAGPAGYKGHEGDLTLRIDSVPSANGGRIVFDDQRFEMNGTNEKAASALAGLIPFVGFFAQFMHGQDEHIAISTPIHTALLRPATIIAPPPFCEPPTPMPSATPSSMPAPTATPSPSPAPAALAAPCTPLPPCPPVTPSPAALLTPVPLPSPTSPSTPPAGATPPPVPAATPTPVPCISPTPYPWLTPYPLPSGGVTPAAASPAAATPSPPPTPVATPSISAT